MGWLSPGHPGQVLSLPQRPLLPSWVVGDRCPLPSTVLGTAPTPTPPARAGRRPAGGRGPQPPGRTASSQCGRVQDTARRWARPPGLGRSLWCHASPHVHSRPRPPGPKPSPQLAPPGGARGHSVTRSQNRHVDGGVPGGRQTGTQWPPAPALPCRRHPSRPAAHGEQGGTRTVVQPEHCTGSPAMLPPAPKLRASGLLGGTGLQSSAPSLLWGRWPCAGQGLLLRKGQCHPQHSHSPERPLRGGGRGRHCHCRCCCTL